MPTAAFVEGMIRQLEGSTSGSATQGGAGRNDEMCAAIGPTSRPATNDARLAPK